MQSSAASFDVVMAAVPYTDRRALSQAWYSALHVAREQSPLDVLKPRSREARGKVYRHDPRRPEAQVRSARERRASPLPGARPRTKSAVGSDAAIERRKPRLLFSERIARVVMRAPEGAMFDVEHEGRRVRVLVRTDGDRMRLIAVCDATLRSIVTRALEEASFLLARGGKRVCCAVIDGGKS